MDFKFIKSELLVFSVKRRQCPGHKNRCLNNKTVVNSSQADPLILTDAQSKMLATLCPSMKPECFLDISVLINREFYARVLFFS